MTWRREPGCSGKIRFASRAAAEFQRGEDPNWTADGRKREPRHAYECTKCGCWHLSHLTEVEAKRNIERRVAVEEHNRALVQKLLKERGLR